MRNPFAIGAATLAVVLSLGLAACGGSESDDSLSNADLIAQADAICEDYNNQLVAAFNETELNNQSSKQEVSAFASDTLVPLYENQVAELRTLEPNEDDAEAYNDIVDTLDSEVQAVAEDPVAAINNDNPFAGATAKANEFGLEVCGSGA